MRMSLKNTVSERELLPCVRRRWRSGGGGVLPNADRAIDRRLMWMDFARLLNLLV